MVVFVIEQKSISKCIQFTAQSMEPVSANNSDAQVRSPNGGDISAAGDLHPWRDFTLEEKFRQEYGASNDHTENDTDDVPDDTDGQEWRQSGKQQQFRKQYGKAHPGRDLSQKDVAHVLSLELAQHIKNRSGLRLDDGEMRRALNDRGNFRMANRETNRVQHTAIDRTLMTAGPGTRLTHEQINRAQQQRRIIENGGFPSNFRAAGIRFYNELGIRS